MTERPPIVTATLAADGERKGLGSRDPFGSLGMEAFAVVWSQKRVPGDDLLCQGKVTFAPEVGNHVVQLQSKDE